MGILSSWNVFAKVVLAIILTNLCFVAPVPASDCMDQYQDATLQRYVASSVDTFKQTANAAKEARLCFADDHVKEIAHLYTIETWALHQAGLYAKAHETVESFFATLANDAPAKSLGTMYVYRGRLAHFAGNPKKVYSSYQQATRYIDTYSVQFAASTFTLIANHYASYGDFDRAQAILDRVRDRLNETPNPSNHDHAWGNLSRTEAQLHLRKYQATQNPDDLATAEQRAQEAIDYFQSEDLTAFAAFSMVTLARVHDAAGRSGEAHSLLDRASLIARSHSLKDLKRDIREARKDSRFVFASDFRPPPSEPVGWPLTIGFVIGIVLTLGSVMAYQRFKTAEDVEWIEVPLVDSGTDLDASTESNETFPMRTSALAAPIDVEDVVAIDEGKTVRCVATLQVIRFFT